MTRIATFLFAALAIASTASARGPFQSFRSAPSRSYQSPSAQSRQHTTMPQSTPQSSLSPMDMSAEQLEKVYGPSILVRETQVTESKNNSVQFVAQPVSQK